jgi:hypothetical protein
MSYSLAIGLSWLRIGCCAHRQDIRWHACCCCVVLCVVRIGLNVMYSNADCVAYSRLCSVMSKPPLWLKVLLGPCSLVCHCDM